ncbi:MAG TPA: peptidoglycan bridge formation glycyltransferase FemA/FemB family protein [Candidatus Coprovivens excrementavium]|nr:peptidoglycan bridge formation glycyltransferase FemA/FemB family protein [Candidatus Coprovivens excrementavium]
MKLKNLSIFEFDKFAESHPLGSYHQSSNYALLASEQGYEYDLLGFVDDQGNIYAASLILSKKIGMFTRYGYAPKGFLIDYYNQNLLKEFTQALIKYYYKKNFAFIKINPEISIGTMDYKNKRITYNKNQIIDSTLKSLNFRKLEGEKHFETKIPQFNAVQILKSTNLRTISKNTRNKINKSIRNGLSLIKGERDDIAILYEFIKNKVNHPINHYYNYYNAFARNNSIDIFLVQIDFEKCLINLRQKYEEEVENNNILVQKVMENPNEANLKRKLSSDNALNIYRENIKVATQYLAINKTDYIAGAITIKYKNRIYILISGYNQEFKRFCPNYFLHFKLIEYYKKDYDFLDLNGITGDFNGSNPYKGLNEFKLGFNPLAFEYIGEYDFIINDGLYKSLDQSGQLAKEFKRKEKSIN